MNSAASLHKLNLHGKYFAILFKRLIARYLGVPYGNYLAKLRIVHHNRRY